MLKRPLAAILLTLGVFSCASTAAEEAGFQWPVPKGWRKETIPFPLGFAPELKYRGTEEIRFAPGFFDPKSDTYWTYAFAWWLEGTPDSQPETLERVLPQYFSGLCQTVSGKKYAFDPSHFRAKFAGTGEVKHFRGHEATMRSGVIDTYDPFVTGNPLRLYVELLNWDCPEAGRHALLIKASPRAPAASDPVWKALRDCGAAFACHP